jgi:4a-hydroxytetrahydrobiopterin dehydratase
MELAEQQCVPCRGGEPPMQADRARSLLEELGNGWSLNDDGHLEKTYSFKNFAKAMSFASEIGEIAESQSHHPELRVGWGHCDVELWTHKIRGLSDSDFYLAAKIERAWQARS